MKNPVFTLVIILAVSFVAAAQDQRLSEPHVEAMKKLVFLVGSWEGDGWVAGHDGQKHSFHQTENIRSELDGVILVVEGIGRQEDRKVHHAYAVLSADLTQGNFDFRTYLFNGLGGNFKAHLTDPQTLVWEIPNPQSAIRYTIRVAGDDRWNEVGEIKRDETWIQFFEMNLTRKQ